MEEASFVNIISKRSLFKDCDVIRSRIRCALKEDKELSSQEYLGYDIKTFKAHIEEQFTEDMTWDNYGKVCHIDHKLPLKYKENGISPTIEEVIQRLHYTNTQPMLASKNMLKRNLYIS